jgi:hypothetical protein
MMLEATDTKLVPWHIIRSDDKRRARLNCISHLLSLIPYKEVPRDKIKLPKRSDKGEYDDQASLNGRNFVPDYFSELSQISVNGRSVVWDAAAEAKKGELRILVGATTARNRRLPHVDHDTVARLHRR